MAVAHHSPHLSVGPQTAERSVSMEQKPENFPLGGATPAFSPRVHAHLFASNHPRDHRRAGSAIIIQYSTLLRLKV